MVRRHTPTISPIASAFCPLRKRYKARYLLAITARFIELVKLLGAVFLSYFSFSTSHRHIDFEMTTRDTNKMRLLTARLVLPVGF